MKIKTIIKQIAFAICLVILSLTVYAFEIEPYRLTINEVDLSIIEETSDLIIVQFSDTHFKPDFKSDELSQIVDEINSLEPDIVIFTGDLYDQYDYYSDNETIVYELNRIDARIGKISVRGNRDYGGEAVWDHEDIITSGGFTLLTNENIVLATEDGKKILLTGIDDSIMGTPVMPYTSYYNIDYSIFLSHEPDAIINYPITNYDLVLCGHTHGGQIDVPFIPAINEYALNETALSSRYNSGLNKLVPESPFLPILNDYALKETTLNSKYEKSLEGLKNEWLVGKNPYIYVNTGIGTTRISARFMVIPEISKFNINID